MAATGNRTGTSKPSPADVTVARKTYDAALRRVGVEPSDDEQWTACRAPSNLLVVASDGRLLSCDYGGCSLRNGSAELLASWRSATFGRLREQLAVGELPGKHCGSCAQMATDGLLAESPMLRDYGHLPANDRDAPRTLVVRVLAGQKLNDIDEIAAVLDHIETLVLEVDSPQDDAFTAVLAMLRDHGAGTSLQLRLRQVGDAEVVRAALGDVDLDAIELSIHDHAAADLQPARVLADASAAGLRARFVFTPDNWFDFEGAVLACAEHGVPIDLHLLDRDGTQPLAALAATDLAIVKDVLISAWPRMGSDNHPSSLQDHDWDRLCAELRALLERMLGTELDDAEARDDTVPLRLPAPDHPLFAADDSAWWLSQFFGHAGRPPVRDWVVESVRGKKGETAARRLPWLRLLCQRLAHDERIPTLLDLLRQLYGSARARRSLVEADDEFSAQFDVSRYGGPWSERLGIDAAPPRKPPFDIGKPRKKPAGKKAPAVTVLIPSYRHEDYIEETLASVLAQDHANFRVVVADDCSPDDTAAKASSIEDPRLEVVVNDENMGLGNSVLKALESIDTPYVAILNSDDLFHANRLSRCLAELDEHPEVQLVTTGMALVDSKGGELTPENASLVLDGKQVFDWVNWYADAAPTDELPRTELFASLLEKNFLASSSNLVARTEWLLAQRDSLRSLKFCLDWQLFLDAALQGALLHIPEPLVAYRLHATNTVWFRDNKRWSYYLEVNRVAADALRRFVEQGKGTDAELTRVLEAVVKHLNENRETDGVALFLNTTLDALRLDRLASKSTRVRKLVQQLSDAAEADYKAHDQAGAPDADVDAKAQLRDMLGNLLAEQRRSERNSREWLQEYSSGLEARLSTAGQERNRLEDEKRQLQQRGTELQKHRNELQQRANRLERELHQATAERDALGLSDEVRREQNTILETRCTDLARDLEGVRKDLESARDTRAMLTKLQRVLEQELSARKVLEEKSQELSESLEQSRGDNERLAQELEGTRSDVRRLQTQKDQLDNRRKELRAELDRESTEVQRLRKVKEKIAQEAARAREETERLANTREFRTGNALWNKTPLGYVSRRGKKWYRRVRDAKDRLFMWGSGLFRRRHRAAGTAVVAACWQWPIYSHTFVYQEMLGFKDMGLDLKMFHWDLGDTTQLHKAFTYLKDHRVQLEPVWENHKGDKEHFEKTRPGRLRSFLERVAAETDREVEDLEKDSLVLQGCTFARMAELAGARYIHSYFFYDQSFMAMQAAWLLDLPRGVSCYADHMLDDWPLKLVPLHVELCDVIVATSARIKRELSEKTDGQFDDKIIVKPNGVDGIRFPQIERPRRQPSEPFDVLSVSRIEPKKGLTYLAEAIAQLNERGHRVVAHIIGSKDPHSQGSVEYADEFERRIEELGIGDQVILHGMMKQEDMAPIIKKSRAFVAPYVEVQSGDKDGIPTAMLEAMASSLPVITTNAGSITEVIDDAMEGLVVEQEDASAFATALELVIQDPTLEQRMAKAARARFDRDFDIRVTERRLHERVAALVPPQRAK